MQNSQDEGLVLCDRFCAFNPSLGVGWREILSWYPVEWARLIEMVVLLSKAQWEFSDIKGDGGPGWHWDLGGASYLISNMRGGYGINEVVNLVLEHIHSLGEFQLTLVARWSVRRIHWLFWHVGRAWPRRMISILW